jgi:hypothetical protein
MNDADSVSAVAREPAGPFDLIRKSVRFAKMKWLSVNRVRLALVEFTCPIEIHRRDFHRLGPIREAARKLDMPSRHSTAIRPEVLRHEKVFHA